MPPIRRKGLAARAKLDSPAIIGCLLHGRWWDWTDQLTGVLLPTERVSHRRRESLDPPTALDELLADAWEQLRDALLKEWTSAHPGSRPWAWWRWDAPEPRRLLSAGGPGEGPSSMWYGTPVSHGSMGPVGEYEGQTAYLCRLKLLLPGERCRVEAEASAGDDYINRKDKQ